MAEGLTFPKSTSMRTVLSVALFFLAGCAALVSASSSDDEGSVATPGYATSLRASNEKASRQQLPFSAGGIFAHRGSYYGQIKGEEDLLGDFFEEEVDDDKGRAGESSKPGWIYVSRAERGIVQLMCVHTVLTPQAQLIRHGEKFKDSDKSGLSAKGMMRAKCLVDVFGKHGRTPVECVWHSGIFFLLPNARLIVSPTATSSLRTSSPRVSERGLLTQ